MREINACENTQDKNPYENENTQGKNLLPYYFIFLLYFQISSQMIGMHCSGLQSPFFQCLTVNSAKELSTTFYTSG